GRKTSPRRRGGMTNPWFARRTTPTTATPAVAPSQIAQRRRNPGALVLGTPVKAGVAKPPKPRHTPPRLVSSDCLAAQRIEHDLLICPNAVSLPRVADLGDLVTVQVPRQRILGLAAIEEVGRLLQVGARQCLGHSKLELAAELL